MTKLRKQITFHGVTLDSTGLEGLTLRAHTDRDELTYITIPYWGVGCVAKAIKEGMDAYLARANRQMQSWKDGATK